MGKEQENANLDRLIPNHIINLAKNIETIPLSDSRSVRENREKLGYHGYRNNFFIIFAALKNLIQQKPNTYYWRLSLLNNIDKDPHDFYKENQQICDEIFDAFELVDKYKELYRAWKGFFDQKQFNLADRLHDLVPNPMGIEAAGIYAWEKLNPLLEKADKLLQDSGIDTSKWNH